MPRRVTYRPSRPPQPDPRARQSYLLAETVLMNTGRPPDLLRVECRPVGGDAYRVNLVTETEGLISRRHSHYVEVTPEGFVAYANPPLERLFPLDTC